MALPRTSSPPSSPDLSEREKLEGGQASGVRGRRWGKGQPEVETGEKREEAGVGTIGVEKYKARVLSSP